jgi:hypothetical protein
LIQSTNIKKNIPAYKGFSHSFNIAGYRRVPDDPAHVNIYAEAVFSLAFYAEPYYIVVINNAGIPACWRKS